MKHTLSLLAAFSLLTSPLFSQSGYPIVDTGVDDFYNNTSIISAPSSGQAFYGQDASYSGNQPSYTDNGNGTVTDNVTGLMWQQDMGSKITYAQALQNAASSTLGGHSDWRLPTIKELYSLTLYNGRVMGDYAVDMFIDTNYFVQPIGNTAIGEREIDAQTWSVTQYVGLTMMGDSTVFGVNFVDGRLKGYPKYDPQSGNANVAYFRLVRGNMDYGINDLVDNGDGTITDLATGLMWQQSDDGTTRDWENALDYAESLTLAGHDDWRLPNPKELHSILDYTRTPSVTNSPAIDPLFDCTEITDPAGATGQYGYYWTGSPLQDGTNPYSDAVYICFGKAQGEMESPPNSGNFVLLDTHGAGAVRNDPKTGNPGNYPSYWGPQGDVQYVFNFTRAVRDAGIASLDESGSLEFKMYPNPATDEVTISSLSTIESITVLSATGAIINQQEVNGLEASISVTNHAPGIYFVRCINESGYSQVLELIVK